MIQIAHIHNLLYVSLYWITAIFWYTHTRLVGARGTWPTSGEDAGSVNVERGVPAQSPEGEAMPRTAEPTAQGGATFTQWYLAKVQEDAQLAAAQISAKGTPLSRAQDTATPRVECDTTDPSTGLPAKWYAVINASMIQ